MGNSKLFIVLLILNVVFVNAKQQQNEGDFFVGVSTGISVMQGFFYDSNNVKHTWNDISYENSTFSSNTNEIQLNVGIKIGWSIFFNQVFGIRLYGNYEYSNFRQFLTNAKVATEDIGIFCDAMINFFNIKKMSLGVFAGFGIGYELMQWNNTDARYAFEKVYWHNGFILPINIGFSATINQKHRIEISTKIPTIKAYYTNRNDLSILGINPYIVSVGYVYIF